jgi:transposase InsO family protein/predicted transcriptional regulator
MAGKAISKKELQAMLKPELVKHAKELGIDTKDLTKDQILKEIEDIFVLPMSSGEDVGLGELKFSADVTAPMIASVSDNVEIMKMRLQFEHEIKMHDKQRDHEFKMARLQAQKDLGFLPDSSHSSVSQFRVDSAAKLLPKLVSEQETETFLITFEKIASLNKWPKEKWAAILQTQLNGKALKVFSELSVEDCENYDELKKAILTAYELCPEVYRKRFRASRKSSTETHADFAFKILQSFKRWLNGVKAWDDTELLRETFLMEQFMESVSTELKVWLTDRGPKSLDEMARLADQFVAVHKSFATSEHCQDSHENMLVSSRSFIKSTRPWKKHTTPTYADKVVDTPIEKHENNKQDRLYKKSDGSQVRCFFCQKTGHKIAQCRIKLQKEENESKKEAVPIDKSTAQDLIVSDCKPVSANTTVTSQFPVHPLFQPYCITAHVVNEDESLTAIKVLRDTGALQSVVKFAVLSEVDHIPTGQIRLLKGIAREVIEVPLVEIHLKMDQLNDTVLCGVIDELPEGVDFLLGNDIASAIAQVGQQVSLPVTQAVVTRAQAAALQQQSSGSNIEPRVNNAPREAGELSLTNRTMVDSIDLHAIHNREELINLQQQDDSLSGFFEQVIERDFPVGKPYYFMQDGVLMHRDIVRKTRQEVEQVVVPRCIRTKILEMAHDIPASGHLGIHKTKARLWSHFYWPGMNKQVIAYCRSCDICQRLGKGGKPSTVPLVQVPIITEPWTRIAIDIVGPLPTCEKSKNRFILTVIDLATHYPEAIALTEHTAAQVAKALITVFSRFGFPSEILTDQGSDFTSELMRFFMSEFNIGHVKISAYRPQSNAICERWNGTMKSMIRALTDSFNNDWDECLPWILFAYREIPVETLGFSPFELTFGRHVYGPLGMLKSSWLRNEQSLNKARSNVIQFMLQMREKLAVCQELALKAAQQAQTKEKLWYTIVRHA